VRNSILRVKVLDSGYERAGTGPDRAGIGARANRGGGDSGRENGFPAGAAAGRFHVARQAHDRLLPAGDFNSGERGVEFGAVADRKGKVERLRSSPRITRNRKYQKKGPSG
jgi:hypothetical protein